MRMHACCCQDRDLMRTFAFLMDNLYQAYLVLHAAMQEKRQEKYLLGYSGKVAVIMFATVSMCKIALCLFILP